jgi:hypothetical protein
MNSRTELSLSEQREMLRQQLSAQRESISRQLEPEPRAAMNSNSRPRNNVLNFLLQRPMVTTGLVAGVATLLIMGRGHMVRGLMRGRLLQSLTTGLAVARVVQSALGKRRSRHSVSEPDQPDFSQDINEPLNSGVDGIIP